MPIRNSSGTNPPSCDENQPPLALDEAVIGDLVKRQEAVALCSLVGPLPISDCGEPQRQQPGPRVAGRQVGVSGYVEHVDREVRWFQSARRHRIGKAHAMHVIKNASPTMIPRTATSDARLLWIGPDDRGLELEILALDLPDAIIVIHVMPTDLRR